MVHLEVLALLLAALAIIIVSCEIFTNGIEVLGMKLGLAETATGSVLAAVGTAMPETIVPLIAIFLGTAEQSEEIGQGAILGAPFMLGTLAMFVGGVAIWIGFKRGTRKGYLVLRKDHAERDMKYFMVMYCVALVTGLLSMQTFFDNGYINYGFAVALLAAYVIYLRKTLKDGTEEGENSCPALYMCRVCKVPEHGRLGFFLIALQVAAALLGIIIGAKMFVNEVENVSEAVGVPPIILAFLIAPIATELPEKFNSVSWYLRKKDTLGFGNITGAMVFQSSIPLSIGLLFTQWKLEPINIASILIALAASAWLFFSIRRKNGISYRVMLASGSLYIVYIVLLIFFPPAVSA
ncbi:MAG: sodium:calcium antiporter [Thermoplasmatota archaeon]|nr:sodium:calcium antiporter [Candidatus Thermoplasmatota archaeon]